MSEKVVLVACASQKLDHPAPAADLYQSAWFKKASRYAQITGDRWYILSAKHGLVGPDEVIAPYDQMLNRKAQREAWARRVLAALTRLVRPEGAEIVFLAGLRYRDPLVEWLTARGYGVQVPMAGLGIGQQLRWLKGELEGQKEKSGILYVYRQDCPDYTGKNYGWDVEYESGRVAWAFRLSQVREDVKGELHRGFHPEKRPKYGPDFDDYRRYGWSVYWGESRR